MSANCPNGDLDPCVFTLNLVWLIMGNVMKLVVLGREGGSSRTIELSAFLDSDKIA